MVRGSRAAAHARSGHDIDIFGQIAPHTNGQTRADGRLSARNVCPFEHICPFKKTAVLLAPDRHPG